MSAAANGTNLSRSPFGRYRAYVARLQTLMHEPVKTSDWTERTLAALNGQASIELQRMASLKARRRYGAYFTGTALAERLLTRGLPSAGKCFYYDPTCGMGDLLLAAARNLPLGRTIAETLTQWGEQLAGTDLHTEFVEGAKARLVLLAQNRHRRSGPLACSYDRVFPHIGVSDGLREEAAFQRATTLLMNPPFGLVSAPRGCKWAGGRVSEAAIFMVRALEQARPGTEVLAILPEVLRSGSFSQHWRSRISELAEVHLIEPYGIFDDSADVDVFIARLVSRAQGQSAHKKQWPALPKTRSTTVADYFDVHVGRVVPHRDPPSGPEYAYIHPRCVPTWTTVREFGERRRYRGVVFQPPFVAVRRTSRPGHPYRATATIIAGAEPVAVENHLIVCRPKNGTLAACKELMHQLKTKTVNQCLDARIRCRHLTTGAVKDIPFQPTWVKH